MTDAPRPDASNARPRPFRVTVYADASLRGGHEGLGYVACGPGRMALGSVPRQGRGNTTELELEAALLGIRRAIAEFPGLGAIEIRSDNAVVAGIVPTPDMARTALAEMRATCGEAGATLIRRWCRGHAGCGVATSFLNSMADGLAALSKDGLAREWDIPLDAFWRLRIMDLHPNLVRQDQGPTRRQAAHILGVGPDVVARLVRAGHLRETKGSELLDPVRFLMVWREAERQGLDRSLPLAAAPGTVPRRGYVDDVESGVRLAPAPIRTVEIAMEAARAGGEVAVGYVIESPGGVVAEAARLPLVGEIAWVPALSKAVGQALAFEPACDEIILSTSDAGAVSILNRTASLPKTLRGPLADLDERLDAGGIEFRADLPIRDERIGMRDPADRIAALLYAEAAGGRPAGPLAALSLMGIERALCGNGLGAGAR